MNKLNQFLGVIEFLKVVQHGSFSAASRELGLSSSALGKTVSRLEARLSTKLLHRTTRALSLTKEGKIYYETCLQIVRELNSVEQCIMDENDGPIGRVRLELPGAFGRIFVLPLINQLMLQYPQLEFSIKFSDDRANLLDENIDLAIRIGFLDNSHELVARYIGVQKLVICASPDYLARNGIPTTLDDLSKHDCIVGWRKSLVANWLMKTQNDELIGYPIKPKYEMSDGDTLKASVIAHCGLSQLPTWLINDQLVSGELVTVLDNYAGAEMPIHAVWPRTKYIKPKIRILIDEFILQLKTMLLD